MSVLFNKERHIIEFFKRYSGTPKKIGEKTVKITDVEFHYKDRTYYLNYPEPIYTDKQGRNHYFFDYDTGQIIIGGYLAIVFHKEETKTIEYEDGETEEYKKDVIEIVDYKGEIEQFEFIPHETDPNFWMQAEALNELADKHMVSELLRASKQKLNFKDIWMQLVGFMAIGFSIGFILGIIAKTQGWF